MADAFFLFPAMYLHCTDPPTCPCADSRPTSCCANTTLALRSEGPSCAQDPRTDGGPDRIAHDDGVIETQMAVGRDGKNFEQVSRRAFVPRGAGAPRKGYPGIYEGDFDAGIAGLAWGFIDKADRTLMYELGQQYSHAGAPHCAP